MAFFNLSKLKSVPGIMLLSAMVVQSQYAAIVQQTLNPLPDSVLIPAATFNQQFVGYVNEDIGSNVYYAASGDLTGDGFPEIAMTGWSFRGFDATGTPPAAPLLLFSTTATGTTQISASSLLGISTVAGTTQPRIMDLNKDGRNDFFYLGHNESPFVPTVSEVLLQNANHSFSRSTLAGPKVESHNSSYGDFNGDGYVDFVSSTYGTESNFYAAKYASGDLPDPTHPDWGFVMLYINDKAGGFTAYPFATNSTEGNWLTNLGSGSATAFGDFDADGKTDIVITDGFQGANNWARGESWLLTNISIVNGVGRGDLKALPKPYFDRDATYAAYPTAFGNDKSHDIKVDVVDVNNDGRSDIVISAILWEATVGTQAGVFQILLNQGGLVFQDATDTSLYNFFLGAGSSHQTEFVDVNGDGFLDIIGSDPYGHATAINDGSGTWSSDPQTWATRILINTGSGKFVQAMWNEFREFTVAQRALAGDANLSRYDHIMAPYFLADGRIGFFTRQSGFTNTNGYHSREAFFDYRANAVLSTGPHGTNPALQGEPGFSEYFYLTKYPAVASAVSGGQYASGLAHYKATGKSSGYEAFAANARIVGSGATDTMTLNAERSSFAISRIDGGYRARDTSGRFGTLTLQSVEKIQFTHQLLDLSKASVSNSYLANLSVRAAIGSGQTLIVGFVVDGGAKPILIRAAGPILNQYGLNGLPDPRLTLYTSSAAILAENDDWTANLSTTFSALGAFAFGNGSKDAALLQTVNGPHSTHAKGTGSGALLVEAYDAGTNTGGKLKNVSARFQVGVGDNILIAGFVIGGTGTKQVLIRAIGPTLASYGVSGTLEDPKFAVYDRGTVIATNDNWDTSLKPTFARLGAFDLVSGSKDAAISVALEAGKSYSVQVSGVNSGTGEALVEIYDADE
jgi:hypothetical protein